MKEKIIISVILWITVITTMFLYNLYIKIKNLDRITYDKNDFIKITIYTYLMGCINPIFVYLIAQLIENKVITKAIHINNINLEKKYGENWKEVLDKKYKTK